MTTGILIVAHGSPIPAANQELLDLIPFIEKRDGCDLVEPAFLEGARPSISDGIDACVARGATTVVIIPFFLLLGKHVSQDLPELVERAQQKHPQVRMVLGRHLGDHQVLGEIVWQRVKEANFFGRMD